MYNQTSDVFKKCIIKGLTKINVYFNQSTMSNTKTVKICKFLL